MEKFVGKWKLSDPDQKNFDKYLDALGVGYVMKKMGASATPVQTIEVNGDDVHIKTETTFRTSELNFTIGKEFEEKTIDGRLVKTTVNFEDGKLSQVQLGEPQSTIIREIEDGKYVMTLKINGKDGKEVVCKRIYAPVQ